MWSFTPTSMRNLKCASKRVSVWALASIFQKR